MFENILTNPSLIPLIQIFIATFLGMILGLERTVVGRTAGPRTYGLVSLGSCLLTIISTYAIYHYPTAQRGDPVSIVSAVVSGIGFIGAGLIIFNGSKISGLTTAAGIWVSAAIGITVGYGYYLIAFFSTFLTLFLFTLMWNIENKIKKHLVINEKEDSE